jgi:hypothetical protein
VELRQRLGQLQQRRAALLVERTPAHPEVLNVEDQIAALEQMLAALPPPAKAASESTAALAERSRVEEQPKPAAEDNAESLRQLREGMEAMEQAARKRDTLAAAEVQAWGKQFQLPTYHVRLAERPRAVFAASSLRLWLLALLAGLAVTAAARMITLGVSMDRPFATAAQAQAAISVPVVGTVRVPEAVDGGVPSCSISSPESAALVIGGIAMAIMAMAAGTLLLGWI